MHANWPTAASTGSGSSLPAVAGAAPLMAPPGELQVTLFDKIRALAFFAWSFMLALPLFASMCLMAPLVQTLDKSR